MWTVMETVSFPNTWVTYIPRSNEASRKNIEIYKDDDLMVFPMSKYDWLWLNNFSIARLKQAKANRF